MKFKIELNVIAVQYLIVLFRIYSLVYMLHLILT